MRPLPLRGTTVLIVEDNFVVADALKYLIDGYGGSVTAIVSSVEGGFDALATASVQVAVLDINLKGKSVVPLAEQLRAQGVPFLFLTGYGDALLLPEHLRGYPRLDKPVDAERLVSVMLQLTGRR
jgi:two-component SAPR family response regulator